RHAAARVRRRTSGPAPGPRSVHRPTGRARADRERWSRRRRRAQMSGFIGLVNLDGAPLDRGLLARMTASLAFRGPDRQAMEVAGNAGFGHTLLRIAGETERDAQPLTLDGQRWVVADARVDARNELVAELRSHGDDRATLEATDA